MRQAADGRMDTKPYRAAAVGLVLLAGLVCGLAGCGSGGGDDGGVIGDPITASFTPSGTVSSPDLVRLTGNASNDLVTLQVVIAGQTTSVDLFAFAFDLVLSNVALVGYIDGSEEFGTALTLGAGQSGVALAQQTADRVTVGVTKLGGAGNGVGPGEKTIVTLQFRVMAKGTGTIAIDTAPPAEPGAEESDGAAAPGVTFDGLPALISGS